MFIVSHTVFFPIIIIISIIYHARMSCIYFWEALSEKTPNRILNYISVARTFYCSIGNYNIFFTADSRRQIDHDKCWPIDTTLRCYRLTRCGTETAWRGLLQGPTVHIYQHYTTNRHYSYWSYGNMRNGVLKIIIRLHIILLWSSMTKYLSIEIHDCLYNYIIIINNFSYFDW